MPVTSKIVRGAEGLSESHRTDAVSNAGNIFATDHARVLVELVALALAVVDTLASDCENVPPHLVDACDLLADAECLLMHVIARGAE